MSGIPYLYVNILALCLFLIMLFALLAAKKTPEIRSFLAVLLGFSIWSGGSILMRLRMFPGVSFWFYVSIMGLFSCGLLLYMFINSFVGAKGCVMKSIWGSGTLVILVFTALGFFLKPPAVVDDPVMGTLFLYDMDWRIGIPVLFFIILIASMLMLFRRYIKEKGLHSPGVIYVIIGSLAVAIGNVIQIIPGNVFPWDMLSGAVFAVMLMFALYRKHMFHMTLVISRSILMLVCAAICVLSAVNFIPAAQEVLTGFFTLSAGTVTAVIAIIFAVIIAVIYVLLKKLFDNLFVREEQQNKLLKSFSNKVTQTLDTGEIMAAVADIISEELRLDRIYVLLPEDGKFVARHCTHPLDTLSFSFAEDSPCINFLRGETPYFVLSEFIKLPLYMSMWETEKELLKKLGVGCVAALKNADEIAGVILLPKKLKDASYTFIELNFLQTVCAIASIALKNAALYERVFSEARVDSLTGVFNYRYFIEKIEAEFDLHGKEALSLIYLDLDDFKLFNQLYGSGTGDDVLRRVAAAIVGLTGDSGTVFRHGGKVFAVILPGYDVRESLVFAEELSRRVSELNTAQNIAKPLSASIGICAAPYSASSAQEMVENADLAVYNAKQAGKGNVQVFHVHKDPSEMNIAERAMQIVDRAGHSESSNYDTYSHTVYALTAAIDAKDSYTFAHSQNVADYAAILATAAGLSDEQIRIVYEAGLLHDIGKISIPESILTKPIILTEDEYEIMKSHVKSSIDMIRHLPSMDYVIPAAISHHERWDGKGYPRGISGDNIPVTGRCLAIADAFDAMTTSRAYRKALPIDYAIDQIEKGASEQFDPELAGLFVSLVRSGEINPNMQEKAPLASNE